MRESQPTLDPSEYATLNDTFFRADPARYLDNRIWALACLVGQPADGEAMPRTLSFGSLSITQVGEIEPDAYAALEATVLLHHACESLLRLYLALSHREPCPWLAIARLRSPREFKAAIRSLRGELDRPDRYLDLLEVFSGHSSSEHFKPTMPSETWDGHREALVELVRHSINVLLGDASYYNAAKHGLAIPSGEHSFKISSNGQAIIQQSGLALEVLEQDPSTRLWRLSTSWVDVEQTIKVSNLVVRMIGSLWESSRAHYGQKSDLSKLAVLDPIGVHELLTRRTNGEGPIATSWSLAHSSEGEVSNNS